MSRQELNAFPAKLAAEGRMDAEAAALVRGSDLAKLTASSLGKRMQRAAAAGNCTGKNSSSSVFRRAKWATGIRMSGF